MFGDEVIERALGADVISAFARAAHRHGFDEAQNKPVLHTKIRHGIDVLLVHTAHQHHIDFDLFKLGLFGGLQSEQNPLKAGAARNLCHAFWAQ